MSNSAFSPTVLTIPGSTSGSGQGELNLITNPVAATDTTGWVGAGRGTAGGPLNPSVGTYFTVLNAASAESSTSGAYDVITLPSGLQNRKLKVEFYYTSPAADTFKVSVYKGTTRVPLSTDSSGTTTLPASTTGKFTAYFDTDSSGTWTVSITRTAGTGSTALQFTQVVVGPGIQPQGAVVGATQAVTFTGSWTTNTTYSARETRDGQWANYEVTALLSGAPNSAALSLTLPTGRTIDTAALTSSGADQLVLGVGTARDEGLASYDVRVMYASTTTVSIAVENASSTYGQINAVTQAAPFTFGNTDRVSVTFRVPIAEWAGSGTVQLAQNDVEYAARTASADVYGPAGTPVEAFAPTGNTAVIRTVTFQTPIQTGDAVVLEFASTSIASGTVWVPASQMFGFTTQQNDAGTTSYGVSVVQSGTKTVDVKFYSQASKTSGDTWSTYTSAWKWRVRKSSAGAAVGFGIVSGSSAGLLPASNSNLDDATATRLGLKQYLHGGSYVGGLAPTVTLGTNVTGGTVVRGVFVPYQCQDGTWRLRLNVAVSSATSTASTVHQINVTGVVFKNVANFYQGLSGGTNVAWTYLAVQPNTNYLEIGHASAVSPTSYYFSGDVELDSKPTWAYS